MSSLFPVVGVQACHIDDANRLLIEWEHELGAFNRPFGRQAWTLEVEGEPIAVAVSGSAVSTRVAGYHYKEVVELARLARHPDHPHILRVMLRLWRAYLAQTWQDWPVRAAVSYALPGKTGDLYRFDGWKRVGTTRPSSGGGTWSSTKPKANEIGDGVKTLWCYRYEAPRMCGHAQVERSLAEPSALPS